MSFSEDSPSGRLASRDSEVRATERINQAILDAAIDAIITVDQRGVIQFVNPSTENIFGYTRDELIGRNISLLMPAPFNAEHDGYIARYLGTREPRILGIGRELVAKRKDGTVFPIDLAISEVEEIGLFTGVIRDISERKEAAESLRREHELNESIVNTARNLVVVLDTRGRVVRLNPFAEMVTGWQTEEVQGRDWFDTFIPAANCEHIRAVFSQALGGQRTQGSSNEIVTKSGDLRMIEWYDAPLTDANGNLVGLLATGLDVTERRDAQQRVLQSERLAAIGEAMTALAHESRNALQRCQAGLEMLARRVSGHAEAMHCIAEIQAAQDDLARLYEDVREFAKPIHFHPQPHQLDDVIHQASEELAESSPTRKLQLRMQGTELNLTCEIDAFGIRQVVRNILENSLAASDKSPLVKVRFDDATLDGRPAIRVMMLDDGPGIDDQSRPHIFEPFFTTKTHGVGLGMAIAKRIMGMHGGEIHVGDSDGGAEFVFTLPRRQPRRQS